MQRFCHKCGNENISEGKFCSVCGADLDDKVSRVTYPEESFYEREKMMEQKNNNFTIIVLLAIVILFIASAAGFYFYTQKAQEIEVQARIVAMEKERIDKEQKEKQEKQEKLEKQERFEHQVVSGNIMMGIQNALQRLQKNENMLKNLVDEINSGSYERTHFNSNRIRYFSELTEPIDSINAYMPYNDNITKDEVLELLYIQKIRAEMMYQGLNGDFDKFAIGGQYYDDYYAKLAAFKSKYGV